MTTPTTAPLAVEDILAILASLQDQIDDLTTVVRRQQASIDRLQAALRRRSS